MNHFRHLPTNHTHVSTRNEGVGGSDEPIVITQTSSQRHLLRHYVRLYRSRAVGSCLKESPEAANGQESFIGLDAVSCLTQFLSKSGMELIYDTPPFPYAYGENRNPPTGDH